MVIYVHKQCLLIDIVCIMPDSSPISVTDRHNILALFPFLASFDCNDSTQYGTWTPLHEGRNKLHVQMELKWFSRHKIDWFNQLYTSRTMLHACPLFDLFARTEIQIKKAISFTTFQCCHSLLNHKSSVMTDFVCFAGVSWERAEEACGVCWAMTDVGQALKCISPSVMMYFGLKCSQLTGNYAAVCTQDSLRLV